MKRSFIKVLFVTFASLLLYLIINRLLQAAPEIPNQINFVWPISASESIDLPQSSAYGPRLQASQSYRYDYHQGLDLPTPINTTLVAVTTGTVRIAGSSPLYSDGIVQITTTSGLYINYMHITASLVTTGQVVNMGQPVALSGIGESGFAHLHFEIRKSALKQDAINPYRYLPYADTASHTAVITEVNQDHSVWLQATTPANELDLNTFTLEIYSVLSGKVVETRTLDFEARNKKYLGDPTWIDIADLDGILISPEKYVTASSLYVMDIKFHDLQTSGPIRVTACAIDVKGNAKCDTTSGNFDWRTYLPLILR